MDFTLTNNLGDSVPVMASDASWATELESNEPTTFVQPATQVVIIGYKPDVAEQIKQGLSTVHAVVKALITAAQARSLKTPALDNLSVTIDNDGEKAIRVILGDGVTDYQVEPGESFEADAKGYIELRELGNVAQSDDPAQVGQAITG